MKGYLNNTPVIKDAITEDGLLKMGDIAKRDKMRFFRTVDRKKELIKYCCFFIHYVCFRWDFKYYLQSWRASWSCIPTSRMQGWS